MTITYNGITYNYTQRPLGAGLSGVFTHGDNENNGRYYFYEDTNKALMALDIDWNGADLSSVLGNEFKSINNTSDLLKAIMKAAQMASATSGPQGPQGARGPQGVQGSPGTAGSVGPQGAYGPQGLPGVQGAKGATGVQGAKGDQGVQGAKGATGATGAQGAQGPQGPMGVMGVQGHVGAAGAQGAQGAKGAAGAQGAQGPQGYTGSTGPKGAQGGAGPQGARGAQGPQGNTESTINTHYTPTSGYYTYEQTDKVIKSITVDEKGHIVAVTFAAEVVTRQLQSIEWASTAQVNGTVGTRPSLGNIILNYSDGSSESISAYSSGVILSNSNFYTAAGTYNLTATYNNKTTTNTKRVVMTAAPTQTEYYYYVGPENPMNMDSISPVATSQAEAGWYYIGTSLPSYSQSNKLLDASENMIPMGSRTYDYLALPNANLKVYNAAAISEMDAYTKLGTKVINGVTYHIYKDNDLIRNFSQMIY